MRVEPIVEKMVEICLKWLGHVWKQTVETRVLVRRVDLMKDSSIIGGRGRQRKIISETIKKNLMVNGLSIDMIYT